MLTVPFSSIRFNTSQYSRCFIPATTKLRNDLSMIVEAVKQQKLKFGANALSFGVGGP